MLRFGPFELDPESEELRRAGLVLRLPRQPLRILLVLVSRAGEVVSRDEIHAAIWGTETHVDFEHGINSAIRQIRYALGDHAVTPRYVRTLPRRGYSFVATVERIARPGDEPPAPAPAPEPAPVAVPSPAPAPPARVSRRFVAIAAIAVVVITAMAALIAQSQRFAETARSREVAVQPFRRLGPPIAGIDEGSFNEELQARLGKLPGAHVSLTARANVVIGGTIREDADGVRAIVSLTDATTQTQLWSETFQRPSSRKEGMAVEVAHRVTCEIARRFLPPPRHEPVLRTRAAPATLSLYRRARLLHGRSHAYDWMRTKELYEAALREEPRLAEAWSGLSEVWAGQALTIRAEKRDEAATHAFDCARRAIALQPDNPEAYMTLGRLAASHDYDLAAAEDALRRAVAADPTYVHARANLAMVLAMRAQSDEALREFRAAQQLDPRTYDLHINEPLLYLYARRHEDARTRYREYLAVFPESQPAALGVLSTYIAQRNWREAIATARTLPKCPAIEVPATEAGFMTLYRGFERAIHNGHARGAINDYFLAYYYAQLNDRERAYELLQRAVDTRIPMASYIMVDPRIDNLRGDPRFNAVLARMKLGRPPARVPSQTAHLETSPHPGPDH